MRERGVDVLLVISPPNLCYLTGFESVWYPPRAPVGVVVCADDERLVFLDYERHETLVRETAHLDDAVFYRYEDVLETIAATFRDRGWLDGAIGSSAGRRRRARRSSPRSAERLGELGGTVVDGDWIVDRVRLVKSPAEVACVRRAAAIVDAAFADLVEHVRPGQTELQIAARLDSVMADHGGEGAAIRTMVSAGPGRVVPHARAAVAAAGRGGRRHVRRCLRRVPAATTPTCAGRSRSAATTPPRGRSST